MNIIKEHFINQNLPDKTLTLASRNPSGSLSGNVLEDHHRDHRRCIDQLDSLEAFEISAPPRREFLGTYRWLKLARPQYKHLTNHISGRPFQVVF